MIINNKKITVVRLEEWNNEACVKISEIQCHLSTDNSIIVIDITMDYNGNTFDNADDIITYVNQNM
jgi:Tfp pilus assembly major pilin PilA